MRTYKKIRSYHALSVLLTTVTVLFVQLNEVRADVPLQELYSFPLSPQSPDAPLIEGTNGNFYGTTVSGGLYNAGTIFMVTPNGERTILAHFNGLNGINPQAALLQASDGNIYGTANYGGTAPGSEGTVFRLTPDGILTNIVDFVGSNGRWPRSSLVEGDDGWLYGTTKFGGQHDYGTVFKMSKAGQLLILHSFDRDNPDDGALPCSLMKMTNQMFYGTTTYGGGLDTGIIYRIDTNGNFSKMVDFNYSASSPEAGLIQATDGNFYGTTTEGLSSGAVFRLTQDGQVIYLGAPAAEMSIGVIQASNGNLYTAGDATETNSQGTIFSMTTDGVGTNLYVFSGGVDGHHCRGLTQGSDGNIYGTTEDGGMGSNGTVFKMDLDGDFSTIVSFNFTNGFAPVGKLVDGGDGFLYGVCNNDGPMGNGTIFKTDLAGNTSLVAVFDGTNGAEGNEVIKATDGNFYGMTYAGGSNGLGTIFKLTPAGAITVLHSFAGGADGMHPYAGLLQANDGNFYGTTIGEGTGPFGETYYGTAFRITLDGTFTTLVNFSGANGATPACDLVQGTDGGIYGTTYYGGASYRGTVDIGDVDGLGSIFKITTNGGFSLVASFRGTNGVHPLAGLTLGRDGNLYGTTLGGTTSDGDPSASFYKVDTNGTLTTVAYFPMQCSIPLTLGSNGNFFGASGNFYGDAGAPPNFIFEVTPFGVVTSLATFTTNNGTLPAGGFLLRDDGYFYGTASQGGSQSGGNIFRFSGDSPYFIQVPTNQIVVAGSAATFSGAASSTSTSLSTYRWQKNGTNLVNGGNLSGADSPNLTIANTALADMGNYSLVVSNSAGSAVSSASLVVVAPPHVSATVNTNGVVELQFTGTPALKYSVWASSDTATWTNIGSSTEVAPGSFIFDDSVSTTLRLYQLRWP